MSNPRMIEKGLKTRNGKSPLLGPVHVLEE